MYSQPMLKEDALKGKTIIVTGGGTGLGKSMGKYFLELGANLVIASRKIEVLEEAASHLEKETRGNVLPVACDVRKYEEVELVLNSAIEKFGRIDVLVNNAAGNFISPTERLSHRAFNTVVDIVLKGSYNFTLALGKYWIKEEIKGNVLSILTTYAQTGSGWVVPSACGKAGVLALTRSLAVEWAKYGIRLNAVAPGPFPTEGAWSRLLPDPIKEEFNPAKKVALQRVGEHQELSNLAAFLISDFSSYITGEMIAIDGGECLLGAGQFNNMASVTDEMWDMLEKFRK